MKKQKTVQLAMLGLFSALVILMSLTPVGYIRTGVVSITLVHIPVLIGAVLLGWQAGLILGGVMGVFSMIEAFIAPGGWIDTLFQNPLVAIPSRMALGLLAALFFFLFNFLFKGKRKSLSIGLAAAVSKLCSTFLTLLTLVLLYHSVLEEHTGRSAFAFLIGSILTVNGLIEMAAGVLITVPVCMALFKAQNRLAHT
ncbi:MULTISPECIES: ECF transporter S component [Caproicibacterium]|uniref:ECF transporter S component n=1 Tax=Caproicibacterium argilliputei TaxID=3030016 RepID=A0AA97DAD9_9FIRM|nr:ECF transporter S component [Caproicibacterium argilliputei]WOC33184.1 ECF transporter S component [Caproicibacterium argilliputei]